MRRTIHVSSLTTGKCFTVAPEEGGFAEGDGAKSAHQGKSVMTPDSVWKVSGVEGDEVLAANAAGDEERFAATTEVVEVPRQGYDRLVERVKIGEI